MRIAIEKYDAVKDTPVYPGHESFRKRELKALKLVMIAMIIITILGGCFLYAKMLSVHVKEGCLEEVSQVYSGRRFRTLVGLDLRIDDTYYYLDENYIYYDGEKYRIDNIHSMEWLLNSDKIMNKPVRIHYLQLSRYDKAVIVGAECGNNALVNIDHSILVYQKQLIFDLLLGTAVFIAALGIYAFRKRYSIVILRRKAK